MITLNKTIYNKLKPYSVALRQAYYSCCITNMSQLKITQISEIAKEAGYNNTVNVSCSSCVIKMLSALGKEYFAYEKAMENNKKKKVEKPVVEEEMIEKGDN